MTTVRFRREHARIGAPVEYYDAMEGLVAGQITRVSYSARTVWVRPASGGDAEWELLRYSQRNDGLYRRRHASPDAPVLGYREAEAAEEEPAYTVQDELDSDKEFRLLDRALAAGVPKLVPVDYARLISRLEELSPREARQPAPREGTVVYYRPDSPAGEPLRGRIVRTSARSVWVLLPGLPGEHRFSRRPDGKYRLEGKPNHWHALEFQGPQQAAEPVVEVPDSREANDARHAAMMEQRRAALARQGAAEPVGMDLI